MPSKHQNIKIWVLTTDLIGTVEVVVKQHYSRKIINGKVTVWGIFNKIWKASKKKATMEIET